MGSQINEILLWKSRKSRRKNDPEKIGILGIYGWGRLALNAAVLDTCVKATVTSTMYKLSRYGYFDSIDEKGRYETKVQLNAQRTKDYKEDKYAYSSGVPADVPPESPQFVKDYVSYYRTPRAYHPRSATKGWTITGFMLFINQPMLCYSTEIHNPVLMIHGEKARSRYFTEDAFKAMTADKTYADNKKLLIVPGATHTDLYDGGEKHYIPFDTIVEFFRINLK